MGEIVEVVAEPWFGVVVVAEPGLGVYRCVLEVLAEVVVMLVVRKRSTE